MGRSDEGHGAVGTKLAFGATTAAYGVSAMAGQVGIIVKYVSGGSFEITSGTTTSPQGLGYLMGTTEAVSMDMASTLYVCATGSTAVINVIRLLSAGNEGA